MRKIPRKYSGILLGALMAIIMGLVVWFVVTFINLRPIVTCPVPSDAIVLVAFGQSNAGNYGAALHRASEAVTVLDWRTGKCHAAHDPLPGASGAKGSLWSRVGDEIAARFDKPVLIVTFAEGGSRAREWADGSLTSRIASAGAALAKAGYRARWVAWQQGETEAQEGVATAAYEASLRKIAGLVRTAFAAPLVAAKSTKCAASPPSDAVRSAIDRLVTDGTVLAGPDFDVDVAEAGDRDKGDCHLSATGLSKGAALWAATIAQFLGA